MNVDITTNENTTTIAIEGSIDSKTAGDIQSKIMEKVSETDKVILDLTKVDFVSSAGLRLLLMIYRQIKSKNGKIVLVGVSDEIKDVMAMTGFINFFEFSQTTEEANDLL